MAISYSEEIETRLFVDIWRDYEGILVDFVRFVGGEAFLGRVSELFDHVNRTILLLLFLPTFSFQIPHQQIIPILPLTVNLHLTYHHLSTLRIFQFPQILLHIIQIRSQRILHHLVY